MEVMFLYTPKERCNSTSYPLCKRIGLPMPSHLRLNPQLTPPASAPRAQLIQAIRTRQARFQAPDHTSHYFPYSTAQTVRHQQRPIGNIPRT